MAHTDLRRLWVLALTALALLFPGSSSGQAPPPFTPSANPVSDAVRTLLARESKNLVASAELMPGDKYAFQPTPAQMTFGQLVAHIVQTNVFICSGIGSTPSPMTPEELKKLSVIIAADAGQCRTNGGQAGCAVLLRAHARRPAADFQDDIARARAWCHSCTLNARQRLSRISRRDSARCSNPRNPSRVP